MARQVLSLGNESMDSNTDRDRAGDAAGRSLCGNGSAAGGNNAGYNLKKAVMGDDQKTTVTLYGKSAEK